MTHLEKFRHLAVQRFGLAPDATERQAIDLLKEKLKSGEVTLEPSGQIAADRDAGGGITKERTSMATKLYGGVSDGSPSTEKKIGVHRKTRLPVVSPFTGQPVELSSQDEAADHGVFFRWLALRQGLDIRKLDKDERRRRDRMIEEGTWFGSSDDGSAKIITAGNFKALLDDSTSGGINAVPVTLDTAWVQTPLLGGELYPYVDVKDVRGRLIEGFRIGNVTMTWGTAEGTAIGLFNTADLIQGFGATVHTLTFAIEIGKDFLSDAPEVVGDAIEQSVAMRHASELDRVIAIGDGTTQPLGIFNTPGLINVSSENGSSGPPTLADLEALYFAVNKAFRTSSSNPAWVGNDISYARNRGMAISQIEQSRVFGTDYGNYVVLGQPFRVAPDVPNNELAFVAGLRHYRLYRRSGFSIHWETGGKELALRNLALLVVRSRYAGRLTQPEAVSVITNGQS